MRNLDAPLVSVGILVVLLSGCAASENETRPTGDVTNHWLPEMKQAMAESTSDFERSVLEKAIKTGNISEADYLEAVEMNVGCLTEKGHDVHKIMAPDGSYQYEFRATQLDNDQIDLDTAECHKLGGAVESLYTMLRLNPLKRDPMQIKLQCMIDNAVFPKGTTLDDLTEVMDARLSVEDYPKGVSEAEREIFDSCLINGTYP